MNSSLSQFGQRADDYGGDWLGKNRRIVSFEEGTVLMAVATMAFKEAVIRETDDDPKGQEHGWRAHILNRLMYCYKYYLKKKMYLK